MFSSRASTIGAGNLASPGITRATSLRSGGMEYEGYTSSGEKNVSSEHAPLFNRESLPGLFKAMEGSSTLKYKENLKKNLY